MSRASMELASRISVSLLVIKCFPPTFNFIYENNGENIKNESTKLKILMEFL